MVINDECLVLATCTYYAEGSEAKMLKDGDIP